ncbi:choice-of-anchor Q domain-containing protein [Fibrella sp. WM1]|uniref:choice-of-anchor Q domain-containing protein n=1 Tax=Fibrella musci TaxID=3242485 RepID=UPI003522C8F3
MIFSQRVTLLLLAWLVTPCSLWATNYYVSPSGANNNPGTLASPFATIQRALDVGQPGDSLLIRAGVYHEKLIWKRSGTSNATITLRNYRNESVTVDGTGVAGDALLTISSYSFLRVMGLTFQTNYQQDAKGIYVVGGGSRLYITNCIVRNVGWINDPNANPETRSGGTGQAHGILVNGRTTAGFTDVRITGCQVYSIVTGNSEAVTIVGNVDSFSITNNQVTDTRNIGIVAAGHYGWAVDAGVPATLNHARNGLIEANVVANNRRINNDAAPAGIYVDGGRRIQVIGNISHHNGNGLSVGCENANNAAREILVANNLVYDNDNHGLVFGSATSTSHVKRSTVINNTLFQNGSFAIYRLEVFLQRSDSCQIANNIAIPRTDSHYGIGIFGYTASNLTVTNNLLYRYTGNSADLYVPGSPAQFNPQNTLTVNPAFVNPNLTNLNLTLQISSPAVNSGTNQYGTPSTTDLSGQFRVVNGTLDMGAYERQDGACPETLTVTSLHLLSGKFVARQRVEFTNATYLLDEPLTIASPRVRLAGTLKGNKLVRISPQTGCP